MSAINNAPHDRKTSVLGEKMTYLVLSESYTASVASCIRPPSFLDLPTQLISRSTHSICNGSNFTHGPKTTAVIRRNITAAQQAARAKMCQLKQLFCRSYLALNESDEPSQDDAQQLPMQPPPEYTRLFPSISYFEDDFMVRLKMEFQGHFLEGAPEHISSFLFEKEKWRLAYAGTGGPGFKQKWYRRTGKVRLGHKVVRGSETAFTTFFQHNAEIRAWFLQHVRVQATYCTDCGWFIYGDDLADLHARSREHTMVKNPRLYWYHGGFRDLFATRL